MMESKVMRADADTDDYRCAVETIIRDIQRATEDTLIDIAENIGASLGTISNAVNRKADLNATYLARLGQYYGSAFLNPYLAMFGAQAAPIKRKPERDILPIVTKVAHKIALARDPEGPGGSVEVPQEKRGYLHDLKELQHTTGCLIAEVESA